MVWGRNLRIPIYWASSKSLVLCNKHTVYLREFLAGTPNKGYLDKCRYGTPQPVSSPIHFHNSGPKVDRFALVTNELVFRSCDSSACSWLVKDYKNSIQLLNRICRLFLRPCLHVFDLVFENLK